MAPKSQKRKLSLDDEAETGSNGGSTDELEHRLNCNKEIGDLLATGEHSDCTIEVCIHASFPK